MVTIQSCVRAFMLSHSSAACSRCFLFLLYKCLLAGTVYTPAGENLQMNFRRLSSVAFADRVAVPVRYLDHEIPRAVRDSLTAEPAVGSEAGSKRQLFFFGIAHF